MLGSGIKFSSTDSDIELTCRQQQQQIRQPQRLHNTICNKNGVLLTAYLFYNSVAQCMCFSFVFVCSVSLSLLFTLSLMIVLAFVSLVSYILQWAAHQFNGNNTHTLTTTKKQNRIRLHTTNNRFSVFIRTFGFHIRRLHVEYLHISCTHMWNGSFLISVQSLFVAGRTSKIQNPLGNVCLQIARNIHQENVYIRFNATNTNTNTQQLTCSKFRWMYVCECVVQLSMRWAHQTNDHFSTSPTVPKLLESLSRTIYTFVILVTACKSRNTHPSPFFFFFFQKRNSICLTLYLSFVRRSKMVGGLLGLSSFTRSRTITLQRDTQFVEVFFTYGNDQYGVKALKLFLHKFVFVVALVDLRMIRFV